MKKWLFIVVGCGAALLVVFGAYRSMYAKPMAEMRETLKSWSKGKDQMQRSLGDATKVKQSLAAIEATTLGPTGELAEHRLRALLTDLCAKGGVCHRMPGTQGGCQPGGERVPAGVQS